MKKYAILIAAFMVIQGAARADHERSTWTTSKYGTFAWHDYPMKADSSVRGAMTIYSTQHMPPGSFTYSVGAPASSEIRADSSQRGAKWDQNAKRTSQSQTFEYKSEPGVVEVPNEFDVEIREPAQGTPGDNVQQDSQTSPEYQTPEPPPAFDTSIDLVPDRTKTDAELQIESDLHPDLSNQSSDYRSESSQNKLSERSRNDLNAVGNDTQLRQTPEQGAPSAKPDTGRDYGKDEASKSQSEATLQENEIKDEPYLEKRSDYEQGKTEAGAPPTSTEENLDSSDLELKEPAEDGATGVQTKDSIDTTIRPEPPKEEGASDQLLSDRVRMELTTGNEGRPAAFNNASLDEVTITSHGSAVTLKGKVRTAEEKRDIEARVKEMSGVTSVYNQIEVTPFLQPEAK